MRRAYNMCTVINTLITESDQHPISLFNIIPESRIKVMKIKKMIFNWRTSWFSNKFSFPAHQEMYKGRYRNMLRCARCELRYISIYQSFSNHWYTFYLLIYRLVNSTIYLSVSLVTVWTKMMIENKTSETTERHTHSLYCVGVATTWVFLSIYWTKIYISTGEYILLISISNLTFTCFDSYVRLRSLQHNRITNLSRIATTGKGHLNKL